MAERLDVTLVQRALAPSRGRAQALVAAGLVEVDGARAVRVSQRVSESSAVRILGRDHPWAGRGGIKLAAALDAFAVGCDGRVCLDAGASTGGFTDVLLSRGAALVYAVDVGYGQLDARLAADSRVRVVDRTNIRVLSRLEGPVPDLVTLDLSFISLRSVLPNVTALAPGAEVIALYKPQFELGQERVGHGGVVRDSSAVGNGVRAFTAWVEAELGAASASAPVPAAIRGAKGNQEWFVHLRLLRHGGER